MTEPLVMNLSNTGARIVHRASCASIHHQVTEARWPDVWMTSAPTADQLRRGGSGRYSARYVTPEDLRKFAKYRPCRKCKPDVEEKA